jgi:hypothetical protein
MRKQKAKGMSLAVAVAYLAMVGTNALANILPFNGVDTGAISDSFPNLFAPAGVTFSIWGVIYTLLALYVLYHWGVLGKQREARQERLLEQVAPLFVFSSVANASWLFAWHYLEIPLSLLLMVIILVCLASAVRLLATERLTGSAYAFLRLPFSVYFGWITVATIANATTLLVSLGFGTGGSHEQLWTILVLAVGTAIGIIVSMRNHDLAYIVVFVWAYLGILAKHTAATGFAGAYRPVIVTVSVCLALLAADALFLAIRTDAR